MKRHWWSLALSWPDDDQRTFSTAHDIFFKETEIHISVITSFIKKLVHILVLPSTCMCLFNNILELSFVLMIGLLLHLSFIEHMICSHSYCFLFTGQTTSFLYRTVVVKTCSSPSFLGQIVMRNQCPLDLSDSNYCLFIYTALMFYIRFKNIL